MSVAFMTNIHAKLGELDEALHAAPARWRSPGDWGTSNCAFSPRPISACALPPGRVRAGGPRWPPKPGGCRPTGSTSIFGIDAAAAVYDRFGWSWSLAQLGRFAEAAEHEAEVTGSPSRRSMRFTIGWAYSPQASSTSQGRLGAARSLIERGSRSPGRETSPIIGSCLRSPLRPGCWRSSARPARR